MKKSSRWQLFLLSGWFLVSAPGILAQVDDHLFLLRQAVDKGNEQRILELSDWYNQAGEEYRQKVIDRAEKNRFFREALLGPLARHPQLETEQSVTRADWVHLLQLELDELIKQNNHNLREREMISRILVWVKEKKTSELLYQTLAFVAYPLREIRVQAYEALAEIGDDRIFPVLMRLAGSEKAIERIYAIDAFYFINDKRTVPFLLSMLGDEIKSVRYYAIRTLEKMQRPDAVPALMRMAQSDENDEVRVRAIEALGELRSRQAVAILSETMADPNPAVRRESTLSLQKIGNPAVAGTVSLRLEHENDDQIKLLLVQTLLALNNSGGMGGLNKIMSREADDNLRSWAIYASGQLRDTRGFAALMENLQHASPAIRAEAAEALGNLQDKRAVPALLALLENSQETYAVQSAVIYAMESINQPAVMPKMLDLARWHHDSLLREQIADSLQVMLQKVGK